jgi:death-on-curing protein
MEINVLTKEIIYQAHSIAIEMYGGNPSTDECTEGKIESIVSQQYGFFGVDKYPSIFDKAAMLLYFIIK